VPAGDAILHELGPWEGVTVDPAARVHYRGRELGRVLDTEVEVRVHPRVRAMLVETGRAEAHACRDRVVAGHGEAI
jgi:hypothetical protein